MSRKGETGGGGWMHPKGANSMAASGLVFRSDLDLKTEVVGTPAEQTLHMFRVWKRGSTEATYRGLKGFVPS